MDTLETIHDIAVGNRCFEEIYKNLEVQELLELEVHAVDNSVPKTTEKLLLKLTIIHRLFQLLRSRRTTCGKLNDVCYYLMSNNIIHKLVFCLDSTNHHVVFMASKAVSSLMLSVPLISTYRIQLENLFENCNGSEWKPLYVMDILKHVIENRVKGNADLHNVRMQSKMLSICNCVSSEPRVFTNEEKSIIELLDFILRQEWMSILPFYVPLWEEIFMKSLDDVTWNTSCADVDLLGYHSTLTSSTHQIIMDGCFDISAKSQQIFVSFLSFAAEFFHWALKSCCNPQGNKMAGRICEILEFSEELLLLKIIPIMPHFLHVKELSSEVWTEILELLSFSLNASTFTQGSHHCQSQTPTSTSIFHLATALVCAVNGGILDNLPRQTGFEGFGGNTIKPVKENAVECCKTRVVSNGIFRQVSLLVVQAAVMLLNSCEDYRNAQLSQGISKAINIWYDNMIKVGTSHHGNEDPYQKGSSSHGNQEASQKESSSHGNQESYQKLSSRHDNQKACQKEASSHGNQESYQKGSSNHDNQLVYHREPSMILMDVFADQDDEMIQMMLLLLQLFQVSRDRVYQDEAVILGTLNPHLVFQAFLKVVGFDHSVLLDFLISSETVFLEYLMQYLHFVLQDWQGFCQTNNNLFQDNITTDEEETRNCQQSYHGMRRILNQATNKATSLAGGIMVCNQVSSGDVSSALVGLGGLLDISSAYESDTEDEDPDDDDDDDDAMRERNADGLEYEEDVDMHDIDAQKGLSSYDNTGHFQGVADSLSTMLEKTMSTLIHTRIATERLSDGSLFPYQVKPLINVLKKVENLYDGC